MQDTRNFLKNETFLKQEDLLPFLLDKRRIKTTARKVYNLK